MTSWEKLNGLVTGLTGGYGCNFGFCLGYYWFWSVFARYKEIFPFKLTMTYNNLVNILVGRIERFFFCLCLNPSRNWRLLEFLKALSGEWETCLLASVVCSMACCSVVCSKVYRYQIKLGLYSRIWMTLGRLFNLCADSSSFAKWNKNFSVLWILAHFIWDIFVSTVSYNSLWKNRYKSLLSL